MIRSYSDVTHGGKWEEIGIRSWAELLAELIIEHTPLWICSLDSISRFFVILVLLFPFPHMVHASGSRPSSGK